MREEEGLRWKEDEASDTGRWGQREKSFVPLRQIRLGCAEEGKKGLGRERKGIGPSILKGFSI